jgi:NAD(P)-dependent dehydrogenase (short-subunit alcohol dehydrogenase family)
MKRLKGKVAIVTGAAGGIGYATTRRLSDEGAAILIADINLQGAEALAGEVEANGGRAVAQQVDLASEASVRAMVEAARAHFGGVDILHNNAAATSPNLLSRDGGIADARIDVWDTTMCINLRGTMLACKYAIPAMVERGAGSIINMSSNVSVASDVSRVAYAVSKGGVNTLTMYIATLHGPQGIRCNAISPGMVMTETVERLVPDEAKALFDKTRLTQTRCLPGDIASVVAFLASDDSRQITGTVIRVDGGMLAPLPTHVQMTELMTKMTAQR